MPHEKNARLRIVPHPVPRNPRRHDPSPFRSRTHLLQRGAGLVQLTTRQQHLGANAQALHHAANVRRGTIERQCLRVG
jgi:hypothetical protein